MYFEGRFFCFERSLAVLNDERNGKIWSKRHQKNEHITTNARKIKTDSATLGLLFVLKVTRKFVFLRLESKKDFVEKI